MTDTVRQLVYAQRCEIGLKRAVNEDSIAVHVPEAETPETIHGAMFIVADGVGSIGSGDNASQWAVKSFRDTYYDPEVDDEHVRERVIAAIQDAQEAVKARARVLKLDALGTTLAGAIVLPSGNTCIFNVGDSRVYVFTKDTLEQITVDQSYADPKVDPNRPKLTSYLGQKQPILPNLYERQLVAGETLLICSDGLWGMLEKDEITNIIRRFPPQAAVDRLVERVYEVGARDNVTVCIVQNGLKQNRPMVPMLAVALALIVIIGLAIVFLIQNQAGSVSSLPVSTNTEQSITTTPAAGLSTHRVLTSTPRSASTDATVENGSTLIVRTSTPNAGN